MFFSSEKLQFFCNKSIFSHSFSPWWLKQTSFYRELNALHTRTVFFPSVSSKKMQNIKKHAKNIKFWGKNSNHFFYILFFKISKNAKLDALLQGFVNDIQS